MPIALRADDHLGGLSRPPPTTITNAKIRAAIEAYSESRAASQPAVQDCLKAEHTLRQQAVEADAQLLADSLENQSADPGSPNTQAADEEITALRRRADDSEIVGSRRLADLQAVLDREGDAWRRELEDELANASQTWQDLLDLIPQAYARVADARALIAFTIRGRYFAPSTPAAYVGTVPEIGVDRALAVLREVAKRLPADQLEGAQTAA